MLKDISMCVQVCTCVYSCLQVCTCVYSCPQVYTAVYRCLQVCLCVSRWWLGQVCHQQQDRWDQVNQTCDQTTTDGKLHTHRHGNNAASCFLFDWKQPLYLFESSLAAATLVQLHFLGIQEQRSDLPVLVTPRPCRCVRWMTTWSTAWRRFWSGFSVRTCSLRSSTEPPLKVSSSRALAPPPLSPPMGTRCYRSRCRTATSLM